MPRKPLNAKMRIEDNFLIIEIDLEETLGLSKSKKTYLIASTNGSYPLSGVTGVKGAKESDLELKGTLINMTVCKLRKYARQ